MRTRLKINIIKFYENILNILINFRTVISPIVCVCLFSLPADAVLCEGLFSNEGQDGLSGYFQNLHNLTRRIVKPVTTVKAYPETIGDRSTWTEIQRSGDLKDQYGNIWERHPEYDFFRLRAVDKNSARESYSSDSFDIFLQILTVLQSNSYNRVSKMNEFESAKFAELMSKYNFKDELFLESVENIKASYFLMEFLRGSDLVSILDLNLKYMLENRHSNEDWWMYHDYIQFLLDIYKNRMELTESQLRELEDISESMLHRSTFVQNFTVNLAEGTQKPIKHKLNSGLIIVESKNINERLPVEVLHEFDVREFIPNSKSVGIVEVGRLGKKAAPDIVTDIFRLAITSIVSRPEIRYVVLEVDQPRRRMWERLGFLPVEIPPEKQKNEFYKSGSDLIMYADVSTLLNKLFK